MQGEGSEQLAKGDAAAGGNSADGYRVAGTHRVAVQGQEKDKTGEVGSL